MENVANHALKKAARPLFTTSNPPLIHLKKNMTPPSHKDKWREEFDKEFEDFFSQETRVYSVDRFKSFIQATHTQLLNEIREWAEKQENKKDCSCTMDEGCGWLG